MEGFFIMKTRYFTVLIPLFFVIVMWVANAFQFILHLSLIEFGIYPREQSALIGIFTAPIVHASWEHLLSNTIPIFILGTILFITYNRIGLFIWLLIHVFTGLLVWLFARESYHVGASGIVYGVASFLFFSGWFRLDVKAIAISLIVTLMYGGLIWGVLPMQPGVSWESHLLGGIVGLVLAYLFKSQNRRIDDSHYESMERKSFKDFLNKIE